MIEVVDFTFSYRGSQVPALQGATLVVPEGQFCAIVGANGAGKTTLCYTLAGFMPQFFAGEYEGRIRIGGQDALEIAPGQLAGKVGLLFQNPFNQISGARFTVREEVAFGLENLGVPQDEMNRRIKEALATTGLEALPDRSPLRLSGGQQQRLAIASVLAMQPSILVLDEPTSQLDPAGSREVFAALNRLADERQTTIVLTEHKLEWVANFADRVVVLAKGRIVADGPPQAVLISPDLRGYGVGRTRYTEVAQAAHQRELVLGRASLPVTLEQAVEFFQ